MNVDNKTHNEILIRDYQPEDWESVKTLYNLAKPDEFGGTCGQVTFIPIENDEPQFLFFHECQIFVAELFSHDTILPSRIVGFAGYKGNYLGWLFILPEYYNRGIGRLLFRELVARVGEKSWLKVAKGNIHAIHLYQSEGFTVIHESDRIYHGHPVTALTMALNPHLHKTQQNHKRSKRKTFQEDGATSDT